MMILINIKLKKQQAQVLNHLMMKNKRIKRTMMMMTEMIMEKSLLRK
jgi:hypothetical protein